MADGQPGRDKLLTRWSALKAERSSWMTHWREISDYLMPRSGRFISSDRNRGMGDNKRMRRYAGVCGTFSNHAYN